MSDTIIAGGRLPANDWAGELTALESRADRSCPRCGFRGSDGDFYRKRPECKRCTLIRQKEREIANGWRPALVNPSRQSVNLAKARAALSARVEDPASRFWRSVQKGDSCWEWTRSVGKSGYGVFTVRYTKILAHRWSWEHHNGQIADGLFVLHHCDNRRCVNPAHLFLGKHLENNRDMYAKGRDSNQFKNATHCPRGHEYATHGKRRPNGHRYCYTCRANSQRMKRASV